jgi:beta-glucanase (GH16 family)
MISLKKYLTAALIVTSPCIVAQGINTYKADFSSPKKIRGYNLVWNDEFNKEGKPNEANWKHEKGFVRNKELQWYQPDNAVCKNGLLVIEGRREKVKNAGYKADNNDWRLNTEYANYTSASIQTKGLKQWQFGRFEIRARIDTTLGSWPAIWTLGVEGRWPRNGEIDIMEFYRIKDTATILANVAWGTDQPSVAKWHTETRAFTNFTSTDPDWVKKFHVWRMDWDKESIRLFLDDQLLNNTSLSETINADGTNPFLQPHFLLLNLAIGGNGGEPSASANTFKYEVDYVRVYQKK